MSSAYNNMLILNPPISIPSKSLNFVFQQIYPTGVVQKLFNIDVSALKPFSRYIRHALQNHIEHSTFYFIYGVEDIKTLQNIYTKIERVNIVS